MVSFLMKSHASSIRKILKVASFVRIGDFVDGAVQNIKQQWLQNFRRIAPSVEVEGLEAAEGKRVLDVVEEESVLAGLGPAVQALLQLADDAGEIRDGALLRLEHVHALDGIPQPALLFEVQPVTLLVALDRAHGRS